MRNVAVPKAAAKTRMITPAKTTAEMVPRPNVGLMSSDS